MKPLKDQIIEGLRVPVADAVKDQTRHKDWLKVRIGVYAKVYDQICEQILDNVYDEVEELK